VQSDMNFTLKKALLEVRGDATRWTDTAASLFPAISTFVTYFIRLATADRCGGWGSGRSWSTRVTRVKNFVEVKSWKNTFSHAFLALNFKLLP